MKGPSQNPQVNSRRQRALAQRQRELVDWQNSKSDLYRSAVDLFDEIAGPEFKAHIATKIERCKQDIANLNAKGVN